MARFGLSRPRRLFRRALYRVRRKLFPVTKIRAGASVMQVDLRDKGLTRSLFFEGEYEPVFQRLAERIVSGGTTCVDVGANIGVHTLHLSRLVGTSGRVFAFEPDLRNYRLLKRNISLNRAFNVTAIKAAAGEVAGRGWLHRSNKNLGDHRLRPGHGGEGEVEVVVLDDRLVDVPPGEVTFIKIDVQGYETLVLRGLRRTVLRNPDAVLLLELSPALLQASGSSADALLQATAELGLNGWEVGAARAGAIMSAEEYIELLGDDEEHLLLSANVTRLQRILREHYGANFTPGAPIRATHARPV